MTCGLEDALISPTAHCGLAKLNRDLLETDIISSRPTHSHKPHLGSKQTHTPLAGPWLLLPLLKKRIR